MLLSCRYYTEALKIPTSKLDKETRDKKRGAAFSNRSLAHLRLSASMAPRMATKSSGHRGTMRRAHHVPLTARQLTS